MTTPLSSPSRFIRAYPPARPNSSPQLWLLFRDGKLLVAEASGQVRLPADEDGVGKIAAAPLYLGTLDSAACVAAELSPQEPVPAGFELYGLRDLYGRISDDEYVLAGYAVQMVAWDRNSRFCPACGAPTASCDHDWGRACSSCGAVRYPPVSPAVLALVHDGDRILLAHKPGWGPQYSILAGFVEPGETLEECVRREVMEEAAVEVEQPVYAGSQPWPFPHQLMVGFNAQYASGQIRIDDEELDDARWFHVDDLPTLPAPLSLSRRLINVWIASRRG